MSALDYVVEPKLDCPNDDANDVAFIRATNTIGSREVVEEFVACKMYPLASSFGFKGVTLGTTPVSKVRTPLPVFLMEMVFVENASRVLVEVEMEAERILDFFGPKEYDALSMTRLLNGGRLNRIFERMGLAYALRALPDSEASQAARDK
jgi:hypothetical protein